MGIKCRSFHQQDREKQNKTSKNNTNPTHNTRPVKTRKKAETTRAPLSPSYHLFHHEVVLHAIPCIWSDVRHVLHLLAQAGLSHLARVVVAWAGKWCPLLFATSFAQYFHICIHLSTSILFLAKIRLQFMGVSVIVLQVAKHPCRSRPLPSCSTA